MKKIIVTGLSKGGYEEYGKRMLNSYSEGFPLIVYVWGMPELRSNNQVEYRDQELIPGLKDFVDGCDPQGEEAGVKQNNKWGEAERNAGYSFRFDTRKFSKMVFTMWDAATRLQNGLMIWIDGDSVFRQPLPPQFFEKFLPDWASYSYLGRDKNPGYTETGFVVFRIPDALPILEKWKDFYVSGDVYEYPEWHSAYMFDRARELFPHIKGHNLTPGGWDHAIHQCEVGKYIDHLKGGRKSIGTSPELTIKWKLENFIRHSKLFPFLRKIKRGFF